MAILACGHGQHVRHDPPFQERAWVLTPAGRAEALGRPLSCTRCDRRELPEGHQASRRTPSFTESTIPKGLLADHATRPGVWGLIHVESGELEYRIDAPPGDVQILRAGQVGVVVPEVRHHVAPRGAVRFHVEFWHPAPPAEEDGPIR